MIDGDAFKVERHGLRVTQPLDESGRVDDNGYVQLDCSVPGEGRRWGRIDYSKGFAQWWFLSHIDFHVPSEHTQEGKHYSAEAQMYHYYQKESVDGGTDNENEVSVTESSIRSLSTSHVTYTHLIIFYFHLCCIADGYGFRLYGCRRG
jgi:hypothetical protein